MKFHLLCGFMIAWTGHVGHVGCYRLDLPHELITNPGIVLEQQHLAITHDAKDFPDRQLLHFSPFALCLFFVLWLHLAYFHICGKCMKDAGICSRISYEITLLAFKMTAGF